MFKKFIKKLIKEELQNRQIETIVKCEVTLGNEIEFSLINYPEDWTIETHYCVHKNGTKLWIANGVESLHINDDRTLLTQPEKNKIWKAISNIRESVIRKSFQSSENSLERIVTTNKLLLEKVKELEDQLEKLKMRKYQHIGDNK